MSRATTTTGTAHHRARALAVPLLPAVLATVLLGACSGGTGSQGSGPAREQTSHDAVAPVSVATPSGPATSAAATGTATPHASSVAAVRPADVTVRLTGVTRKVSADGVKATYPSVRTTSKDARAAARARTAVETLVRSRVKAFTTASAEFADRPASERFLFVDGRPVVWGHHLTVVLDESAQLSGVHPTNSTHVVVLDRRTGRTVRTADLFTDPKAVDRLVRATLLTTGDPVGTLTEADVAPLSIVPGSDGSTSPLSCWPQKEGLTCTVDQGTVLPHAAGPLPAVVPWKDLAGVLRDGVR